MLVEIVQPYAEVYSQHGLLCPQHDLACLQSLRSLVLHSSLVIPAQVANTDCALLGRVRVAVHSPA